MSRAPRKPSNDRAAGSARTGSASDGAAGKRDGAAGKPPAAPKAARPAKPAKPTEPRAAAVAHGASRKPSVAPTNDAPRSRTDAYQQRRPDHPRRVHHGIRLRRKAGLDGFPWWAQAWFKAMEAGFADAERLEGLEYAQSGQVVTLDVTPGTARMKVQGRATRPYELTMSFHPWTNDQWSAVIAAMSQEAIHAARLLTGELPQGAERLCSGLGLRLFPAGLNAADPAVTCSCKERAPCKHAYAALCVLTERIEVDPLVLFTLRGLLGERLLERIQEHRALTSRGVQCAHNPPPIAQHPPELPPITDLLHDFWRPGRTLAELDDAPTPQHIPHALLRRLGQSTIGGRFRLVGLLASAYDTIRQRALNTPDDAPPPAV